MAKARKTGTIARLEQQLHRLNQERAAVIAGIRAAVHHLMNHASADPMPSPGRERRAGVADRRKKRNVSPAVRARLSKLAKARWAAAKKAGKSKLGI